VARNLTFAYPGDLDTLTGGYLYDKHIIEALRHQGWHVDCLSLNGDFPQPDRQDLQNAVTQLAAVPAESHLVIDGLALGALGELAQQITHRRAANGTTRHCGFIALVHHPLALESGISDATSRELATSEAAALRHAAHVIVTSDTTRRTVQSMFTLDTSRLTTVVPGTERSAGLKQHSATRPRQRTDLSASPRKLVLLSVGSVIARKGYDILVQALAGLKHLDWELRIVGDAQRDRPTSEQLQQLIQHTGLQERIRLLGNLPQPDLETQYQAADVFVLASHYEGYGMAYAEAMLWGLPIIGTTGGAIAQTASAEGSLLVEPGNVSQLRQALQEVLTNHQQRARMAQASRDDGQQLPDWHTSAQRFANAILATT
jgi:glycosyltransferase involved in cell wall biosynthesis